jgi:hypothetical protein
MSKKVQKTYQATSAIQLDTYCLVDGQKVAIEFRGGTITPRRNGIFQTSDPKLIAQLDADIARVGEEVASYKCINITTLEEGEPGNTGYMPDDLPEKNVPDISTVTAAREWLLSASESGEIRKGITPSMIKNRVDVLRIAGENKVNFTDLPKS